MQKFTLEILFHIIGIGSASGIIYTGESLFMISDYSTFLYEYHADTKRMGKIKLFEDSSDSIAKKDKPDFEAITQKGSSLYIFGSGSTAKRQKLMGYDLLTKEITEKDLSGLYRNLKEKAHLSDDDLNIEGALFHGNALYLFQRGNGAKAQNGVFVIDDSKNDLRFIAVDLPEIDGVKATFTDAVLVDGRIYFLAAAEDSLSTYEDGKVSGSLLGMMDPETFEIKNTVRITDKHKFEGLAFYKKEGGKIVFFLCEDNDTEAKRSDVYKLTVDL